MSGRVHSYETMGALDGPGLRLVVFLQGCPLRCRYCHNPDTWATDAGQEISVGEIVHRMQRLRPYFGRLGGLTLSGGEPLLQPEFCREILHECRRLGIHSALDTSGGVWDETCREIVDLADLIILDIKATAPAAWQALTSRDAFAALASMLTHLRSTSHPVWVRQVVAQGLNDQPEDMLKLLNIVSGLRMERLELLPYHDLGRSKWERLGIPYAADNLKPPRPEVLAALRKIIADNWPGADATDPATAG
ncbi:MAG: pyruvate formate-lyase-activating protein [Lentisphaeria bacterium]|jgi:pyruvate formate lyase activating enzyme